MSKESRQSLIKALGTASREYQRSVDAFDDEAAQHLGINRTDLRCLDVLLQMGLATPGQLAKGVVLTSGSVTAMLDRLQDRGYLSRVPDLADRRQRAVRPTGKAIDAVAGLWRPLAEEGARLLARYSTTELALVLDYLRRAHDLQAAHSARVRQLATKKRDGQTTDVGRRRSRRR